MSIINISAKEFRELIKTKENLEIIDVRQPEEYAIIYIKDSKLIPLNEIAGRMNEIDFTKEVVFLCRSGSRSNIAASIAAAVGHEAKNLEGGIYACYKEWGGEDLEINKEMIGKYF
jgi:rhodanese-related sulfurtransferase